MSTVAYANVKAICTGIEHIYGSAVCSGIVGNRAHQQLGQGSYHLSRKDNPPRTYSVIRPDDRAGNGPDDASAGFDISMNRADMILCTSRLKAVWSNPSDPRRKYLNAFNGWVGSGDAQRFDMVTRKVGRASSDHKWHIHAEIRRIYILSAVAVKAILSAFRGESIAVYLLSVGIKPAPSNAPKVTPVPRYPGRVLKRVSVVAKPDSAVKVWQERMVARGWKSIGKADGKFGPKTESVVRRYQASCRVGVDGQIGPKTWPLPWSKALA